MALCMAAECSLEFSSKGMYYFVCFCSLWPKIHNCIMIDDIFCNDCSHRGRVLFEYRGEYIRYKDEVNERLAYYRKQGVVDDYILKISNFIYIDPTMVWCIAKYLNSSYQCNVIAVQCADTVFMIATADIFPNTEATWDYGITQRKIN